MAGAPDAVSPPGIAALPPTTVRQLGASNVLRDPGSVVKELIENALDARANAVFVDISANTLDCIQVKDTGHGISTEDRLLVCRRYCTSKIRDFRDLKEVGGKWLGFRGEALASMAEMSDTLEVITRVEGEPVAVQLKYGRNGELNATEHASAPVGTTVKVTNFFQTLPVRKETALKESAKTLAKIRRLMQAYAFARPAVRLSLRVLKAKSNKSDFMYAPKKDANVEDAALKVVGKDCALQCDWTAMESDGFGIYAFLPRPDSIGTKIANEGAFLSIDGRPVSPNRGTPKKVVAAFKERLRHANSNLGSVKDPFMCMNIICPPGSYDPNIEPAKDDVLFEDGELVVGAVTKLLTPYYPEAPAVNNVDDKSEAPASAQRVIDVEAEEPSNRPETSFSILEEAQNDEVEPAVDIPQGPPKWRSSMYGIDEEDLEFISSEIQPPIIEDEEEEERRAATISNPWTIARMNAPVKAKQPLSNGQMMTPAKGRGDVTANYYSSPAPTTNPRQRLTVEPLTPQTSSRMNMTGLSLDEELQENIRQLPRAYAQRYDVNRSGHADIERNSANHSSTPGVPLAMIPLSSPVPRRSQRKQQPRSIEQSASEGRPSNNDWFGKRMRGGQASSKSSRPRKPKRTQGQDVSMFNDDGPVTSRRVLDGEDRLVQNRLFSEKNTDIRDFLGRGKALPKRSASLERTPGPPSFTPINRPQRDPPVDGNKRGFPDAIPHPSKPGMTSRASSAEPPRRPKRARTQLPLHSEDRISFEHCDFADQLREYAEHEDPSRSRTRASSVEPTNMSEQRRIPTTRPDTSAADMAATFAAYSHPTPPTPIPTKNPHNHPSHDSCTKARPLRRRTTDAAQRPKSSRLPLERVPNGYRIQNIVLPVNIAVKDISKFMHKIDMQRNSLEWGYPVDDTAYDAFSIRLTDDVLRTWTRRIDTMFEHFDTRVDDGSVLRSLEMGIVDALRDRNDGGQASSSALEDTRVDDVGADAVGHALATFVDDEQHVQHSTHQTVPSPSCSAADPTATASTPTTFPNALPVTTTPTTRDVKPDDDVADMDFADFDDDEILMAF